MFTVMFNGVDSRDANYENSGRLAWRADRVRDRDFRSSSYIDLQAFASLEQEIEQDASSFLSRTLDDAQEIEQDGTGYRAGTREVEGAHRAG